MKLNSMTKHFAKSKLALALSTSIALVGCGGSGQDDGAIGSKTVFSGQAIDGYLARSTVYLDSNNNGTRDAWEAWAFTDNDGYYSYNPKTNTDYCAVDATPQQTQYCLRTNVSHSNVVIRIDGGYDVTTGEPFLGQMSRRVNALDQTEISNSIVSPLTTLLSDVTNTNERASVLSALNIQESDLNIDYLNTDGSGAVNAPLLNTALKIHKVVSVLSDRLTDTYTEIGEDFGTPNDATSSVYPSLAQQILNARQLDSSSNLDSVLSNKSSLVSALDAAENTLRSIYERKDIVLPPDMGSADNYGAFLRVTNLASEVSNVVNSLIDRNSLNFDLDEAKGSARALEALVIKTVQETSSDDTSIDSAIDFFKNNSLVDDLKTSLNQNNFDLIALINSNFSTDIDTIEKITNKTTFPIDVSPFTEIAGKQIKISDLDLGSPSDLEDKELEIYFSGETGDIEGAFTACVKYIDDTTLEDGLGDGNTRGELIYGFWSLLGASTGNVESYSLLITLTFLGTTYQAIMKPAGEETVNSTLYKKVRFDFDGDLVSFHSEDGIVNAGSIPTTNAECQTRLPTRVGL